MLEVADLMVWGHYLNEIIHWQKHHKNGRYMVSFSTEGTFSC